MSENNTSLQQIKQALRRLSAVAAIAVAAIIGAMPSSAVIPLLSKEKRVLPQVQADSVHRQSLLDERVIVKGDTVGIILPDRNFGRYDRGLFNFLFIPKGQWALGMTASYGAFDSKDVTFLNMVKDFDFKGEQYSIRTNVSYFIKSNTSVGLKVGYRRGDAALNSFDVDFDDDINFALRNVGYQSQFYSMGLFYRNYVGLSSAKRFAIFNEVDLSYGTGRSRFKRYYNDKLRDTRTTTNELALNFSPGLCVFVVDYLSFNVSFGVFGVHFTNEKQRTDGTLDGSRFSSGANFRFNLFNINFGIGLHI